MTNQTDSGKPDAWLERLEEVLVGRRARVNRVGSMLEVQFGRSFTAAKSVIDPAALWPILQEHPAPEHERLIQGFASGVHQVLLEPKRSKADQWDYAEVAASLTPNLEVFTFKLGAAAAGDAPWTLDFHEDLVVSFIMDLNIGRRVLTQKQVEEWGASDSRVWAAGRSILYHKSSNAKMAPLQGSEQVGIVRLGDEFDAIRSIIAVDLFFGDFQDEFRVAMPSQDALLYVTGAEPEQLEALKSAADKLYAEADYPLSRSIYTFERGEPRLEEERGR